MLVSMTQKDKTGIQLGTSSVGAVGVVYTNYTVYK